MNAGKPAFPATVRIPDGVLRKAEDLVRLMDDGVPLPVVRLRVPFDPLVGLIPGAGDVLTVFVAGSILLSAVQHRAPAGMLARMTRNIIFDCAFGTIPIVGDVFDIFFKANKRNLVMLRQHMAAVDAVPHSARTTSSRPGGIPPR